jgi:hypothetical protein
VCVDAADLVRVALGNHLEASLKGTPDLRPDLLGRASKQRHFRGQHLDHLRLINRPYGSGSP